MFRKDTNLEEQSKAGKIISRVISIASSCALLAFAIFLGILLYRSTTFDLFNDVEITESLKESYKNNSDTRTRPVAKEGLSLKGVLKITELVFIEKLDENGNKTGRGYMQFNARYNKRHIESDEMTEHAPNLSLDDVSFIVSSKSGNNVKETYSVEDGSMKMLKSGDKYQYRYFKYEIDDIDLTGDSVLIELRIGGVVWEEGKLVESTPDSWCVLPDDSALLWEKDRGSYKYKLSKKEKNELLG